MRLRPSAARVTRRPVKVKPQMPDAVGNLLQPNGAVGASIVFIGDQPIRRPVWGVGGKLRFLHYSGGSAARRDSVIPFRGVSRSPELARWNRGQGRAAGKTSIANSAPGRKHDVTLCSQGSGGQGVCFRAHFCPVIATRFRCQRYAGCEGLSRSDGQCSIPAAN